MAARTKGVLPKPQPRLTNDQPGTRREFKGRFQPRASALGGVTRYESPTAIPLIQPRRKAVLTNGVQR